MLYVKAYANAVVCPQIHHQLEIYSLWDATECTTLPELTVHVNTSPNIATYLKYELHLRDNTNAFYERFRQTTYFQLKV